MKNRYLLIPVILVISACSGGSDDSGSDETPPTISITSHSNNEEIIGDRTISLAGTVSEDTTSLSVNLNGNEVTGTLNSIVFSVDLQLGDRENEIEVVARDAAGNTSSQIITLSYPFLTFDDGQDASMVIGQPDFTSSDANRGGQIPSANSLDLPSGNLAMDSDGRLYVPDSSNNRILVFDAIPDRFDINATNVIGQIAFDTDDTGTDSTSLSWPVGVFVYETRLFVVDSGNNRILIWDSIPTSGDTPADVIIDQALYDEPANSCYPLNRPLDVFVVNGKVIVADTNNHRVLVWNDIPTQNGQPADLVLGQTSFTNCVANDSNNDGASDAQPAATTLNQPVGIWSDGQKMVVSDGSNNRVLIWDSFPTQNGMAADLVLGQASTTTNDSGTSQTNLSGPANIRSNNNQLFVVDISNARVLIWHGVPTSNNVPASKVLGHSDFVTGPTLNTSASEFRDPFGLLVSGDKLLVTDLEHNRVLIFTAR